MSAGFARDTLLQSRMFAAVNKECFKWDYNPFEKHPPTVFHKKAILKNFAIFTGKHLCSLEPLFNKVAEVKPCNFIQNRSQHRFFLWILRTFNEHLFWRTSANRYFCLFQVNSLKHLKKPILKPKWHSKFENTLHNAQVMKRNHWNVPLCIFMFSCANLYYRYAQSNSYRVMNFKLVKITDMKFTLIWSSYHF